MAYPTPSPFASQYNQLATPVGRNAHIFQPPKTPASATTTPSYATSVDYFSTTSRKRARPDSSHATTAEIPIQSVTPSWDQLQTPGDGSYFSNYGHSSTLVNERYQLRGGFDTPGLATNTEFEQPMSGDEMARRRTRRDSQSLYNRGAPLSGPLARERNGAARMQSSPNGQQQSWKRFAFDVAGKLFNFGTSVFKGFYAGGGKGYDLDRQSSPYAVRPPIERESTPVPGSWQQDDFDGDFEQDNPFSPPLSVRQPNKRRQTDKDSWVMVGTPDFDDSSPRRKTSAQRVPTLASLANRPSASKASSRRSLAPVTRRQSSHTTCTGSPAQTLLPTERRASFAPTRSPGSKQTNSRPSSSGRPSSGGRPSISAAQAYVSPEAERFVKKQAKQGRLADKAMTNMSRQLDELIRQGQQALGTKIEVEGDTEDEGFVDERW